MLIVGVELDVFAHGEQATRKESGGAPFVVLIHVIGFGSDIGDEVIGPDGKGSVERQFVPITLGEFTAFPIEIRAVAIREGKTGLHGKVRGHSD